MFHIFISYSHKNRAFAKHIEAALQTSGYPVWRDESHGVTHRNWQTDVLAALDKTSVMLLILSPDSLASKPVDFEIKAAQARGIPIVAIQYIASAEHPRLENVSIIDFTQTTAVNSSGEGISPTHLFEFVQLLQMLDNALPLLHYLGQWVEVDAQVRRFVATSIEANQNHLTAHSPQLHPPEPALLTACSAHVGDVSFW